mgnify:CR=1 FL=1
MYGRLFFGFIAVYHYHLCLIMLSPYNKSCADSSAEDISDHNIKFLNSVIVKSFHDDLDISTYFVRFAESYFLQLEFNIFLNSGFNNLYKSISFILSVLIRI